MKGRIPKNYQNEKWSVEGGVRFLGATLGHWPAHIRSEVLAAGTQALFWWRQQLLLPFKSASLAMEGQYWIKEKVDLSVDKSNFHIRQHRELGMLPQQCWTLCCAECLCYGFREREGGRAQERLQKMSDSLNNGPAQLLLPYMQIFASYCLRWLDLI